MVSLLDSVRNCQTMGMQFGNAFHAAMKVTFKGSGFCALSSFIFVRFCFHDGNALTLACHRPLLFLIVVIHFGMLPCILS